MTLLKEDRFQTEVKEKSWLKKSVVLSAEHLACWLEEPNDTVSRVQPVMTTPSNSLGWPVWLASGGEVSTLLNNEIS